MRNSYEIYHEYYDILHNNGEYQKDVKHFIELFKRYNVKKKSRILDVGCGTGAHISMLEEKGYKTTGIDTSENMIKYGKKIHPNLDLRIGDIIKDEAMEDLYDVCICNDNVLGYILEDYDLETAIKNIRNSLKVGGLFICSMFNGISVIRESPKVTVHYDNKFIRISEPYRNLLTNRFDVVTTFIDDKGIRKELHKMKYHLPWNFSIVVGLNGFKLKDIYSTSGDSNIEDNWDIRYVFEAI